MAASTFNQGQPAIELPILELILFILIATGGGWAITFLWHRHDREKAITALKEEHVRKERQRQLDERIKRMFRDRGGHLPRGISKIINTTGLTEWRLTKAEWDAIDKANKPTTKETTMRALDLSPAMIGKTIRIEKEGIVGTHNYLEGTLQNFDFNVTHLHSYGYDNHTGSHVTGLEATISGIELNLTGNETLTIIDN